MRKILTVTDLPAPSNGNPWNIKNYPGPGFYRFLPGPGETLPGSFKLYYGDKELDQVFVVGPADVINAGYIISVPADLIESLPDLPVESKPRSADERPLHLTADEWSPGSMVVPAGSGFVSEAGLIEICRALAHCPPNAPGQ